LMLSGLTYYNAICRNISFIKLIVSQFV